MCKREGIFFSVMIFWIIVAIIQCVFFPNFVGKLATLVDLVPIEILFCTIVPRIFSNRYNDWLETDFFKKIKK